MKTPASADERGEWWSLGDMAARAAPRESSAGVGGAAEKGRDGTWALERCRVRGRTKYSGESQHSEFHGNFTARFTARFKAWRSVQVPKCRRAPSPPPRLRLLSFREAPRAPPCRPDTTTHRIRPRWQASSLQRHLARHCALADARARSPHQHDRDLADFHHERCALRRSHAPFSTRSALSRHTSCLQPMH